MGSDRERIFSSSGADCSMGIGYSSSSTARTYTTTNAQRRVVLGHGIMPPAYAAPLSMGASICPAQWQVNSRTSPYVPGPAVTGFSTLTHLSVPLCHALQSRKPPPLDVPTQYTKKISIFSCYILQIDLS